jgi:hypothetical protein
LSLWSKDDDCADDFCHILSRGPTMIGGMLPTFMSTGQRSRPKRPDPPPSGRVERVYLVQDICNRHQNLRRFECQVGVIEGYLGDEVLVRFGGEVLKVPPEMLEPAEG